MAIPKKALDNETFIIIGRWREKINSRIAKKMRLMKAASSDTLTSQNMDGPMDFQTPAADKSGQQLASSARCWPLALTILLVALACFRFPQATLNPALDPSWNGVLVYAQEKGLQFGRDIVFSFGPLGFMTVECFSPYTGSWRILYEVMLGCGIATGICLLAWRMENRWRVLFLAFFAMVAVPLHWGGDDLLLFLGLLSWSSLCWLESGWRLKMCLAVLVVLAAVAALTKFNLLLLSIFTLGLLAGELALRGRRGLAAGVLGGFAVAFLTGWMVLGQSVGGLGDFLKNSWALANGYNQAMGLREIGWVEVVLVPVVAMVVVVWRAWGMPFSTLRRGLFLVWMAGLIFLDWKYACVRTDYDHVSLLLGFMPMAALALEAWPGDGQRVSLWQRAGSVLCLLIAVGVLSSLTPGFFLMKSTRRTFRNMVENAGVLANPNRYVRDMTEKLRGEQQAEQLPKIRALIGDATVDVFGQNQAVALLNGFNYQPRPVFQSYAAFSRGLMELNDQFYASDRTPKFVLFNLSPIDGRFPMLEDAFVLRQLLVNYEWVTQEGNFLLLRKKGNEAVRLKLVQEGVVGAGEKIGLQAQAGTNLWLEVDLKLNWLGRLRQFLYQPSVVTLAVWSGADPASANGYSAPAPMLAAGFLISPLELSNDDLKELYTGGALRRPPACAVELAGSSLDFWEREIHYRVYLIENQIGVKRVE